MMLSRKILGFSFCAVTVYFATLCGGHDSYQVCGFFAADALQFAASAVFLPRPAV
jgi:hypothetical protein